MSLTLEQVYNQYVEKSVRAKALKDAIELYQAVCFIMGANDACYGDLKHSLKENRNLGRYEYPKMIHTAYKLLMNFFRILNAHKIAH